MTTSTTSASQITGLTIVDNCDVEFEFNGRLYQLEIDQDVLDNAFGFYGVESTIAEYGKCDYIAEYGECESEVELNWWKKAKLTDDSFIEVIVANTESWEDVTECTDRGQALLRRNARRSFLSFVVSTANKLRRSLGNMSTAMHAAWTKARILASGIVNFVKVNDDETIYTRRVSDGGIGKNGLLLFTDLDKFEFWLAEGLSEETAKVKSYISMHVWQVVSW